MYRYLNSTELYNEQEIKILKILYTSYIGRLFLKLFTRTTFSKIIGIILNSRISKLYIKHYVASNKIDLTRYEKQDFSSFNDFFTRKIKKINMNAKTNEFVSTAESKIMCYSINKDLTLNVKNTKYSIKELVKDEEIAEQFEGGLCIIYRLEPSNYHRFIFPDDGEYDKIKRIQGRLHTVNPIVYSSYKVFTENTREIGRLKLEHFGEIVQIEVGALCVGKIQNYDKKEFKKYEEKGFFEFGGSTIIQLLKDGTVKINEQIIENSKEGIETAVSIADVIGIAI